MKFVSLILIFTSVNLFSQPKDMYEEKRKAMVEDQIIARGITDAATIRAMKKVPRHQFIPEEYQGLAYIDGPLLIGYNQTISQPYIVAYMTEVLNPSKGKKALEIGTGSGYQAAILAEIVDNVYSVEIIPELAENARKELDQLGYTNITIKQGDGYKGWPEFAPFDIIIVTAACDHIPQPLIEQLAENGKLVIPIGEPRQVQKLVLVVKKNGKIKQEMLTFVRFVPFTRE